MQLRGMRVVSTLPTLVALPNTAYVSISQKPV